MLYSEHRQEMHITNTEAKCETVEQVDTKVRSIGSSLGPIHRH